jgi:hypothetical protein
LSDHGHYANKCPVVEKEDGAAPAAANDVIANVTVTSQFLIVDEEF